MEKELKKPLIPARVFMVGEGKIPRDVLEKIEDDHLKIFLREPNPELWPEEIKHLATYLPEDEQVKWKINKIISRYKNAIDTALREWLSNIEDEIIQSDLLKKSSRNNILENILDYLRELIEEAGFLTGNK